MSLRIDQLDLKQLRVLLTLAQTRNTYRAAEQLHLSQSAVSRALAKLRVTLDDPVFIRSPGGLEPTALTERLVSRLPEVLDLLAEAVDESAGFNPAEWNATMEVALSSHVAHGWGQDVYRALSAAAPGVTWNLHTWRAGTEADLLEGRTDFGLHLHNEKRDQNLYQHTLSPEQFVMLVRQGHPLADGVLHLGHFSQYGLLSLLLPDWNEFGNLLEAQLAGLDVAPRIGLRVESLSLALQCLRESDLMMAGTRALAEQDDDLLALDLPASLTPPESPLVLCYPRRLRQGARYKWITSVLEEVFG